MSHFAAVFKQDGSFVYIGTLHTKANISFNKQLNLTTKIGMVGVLGIGNLPQKFGASISKFVDFFLMSNFC